MDEALTTQTLAGLLGQGVVAVALGTVLHSYYARYRHLYLAQWAWSWWAMAVYLTTSGLALLVTRTLGPVHGLRTVLSLVSVLAGYWSVAWLLVGTYQIASGNRVGRTRVRWILIGLSGFAVVTVGLFATTAGAALERLVLRVGLRGLVAGIGFVAAGVGIWWVRQRRAGGLGPWILAVSLVAYGLDQLHTFAYTLSLVTRPGRPPSSYLVAFDHLGLVLLALIGIGMVAWLLEEEGARLEAASARIEFLASHDPLTGLPNRHLFLAELRRAVDRAAETGSRVAVLCFDLHGFKWVNESLGHRTGDVLLRKVGERLGRLTPEGGAVARLSGDEFAVLAPSIARSQQARSLATRVVEALSQAFPVDDRDLTVVAHAGFSVYPDDSTNPEALLSNATAALSATPRQGRIVAWEGEMSLAAADGFALEGEIQRAFDRNELVLFFQPILDVETDSVVRVEALSRWQHPDRGLIDPVDFFPAVELAGLSDRLDLWALEQALAQLASCRRSGHSTLRMAVNIAPRNLRRPDLAGEIRRLIQRAGLSPEDLEIEITEAAAIQIDGASLDVLNVLDRVGVGISLDDFGTGYSSLSYLRRLPVDVLKIDRAFVHDLGTNDQAADIIRAVITLGRDLGLTVVAEGVETDLQRRLLEEQGCHLLQGYAISPPVPGSELDGLLRQLEAEARLRRSDGAA